MHADTFQLAEYLERVGLSATPAPTISGVAAMMRAQLFAVPFENLDVQAGHGVSMLPEDIVAKIVTSNRGGYCYEVNGLFAMALSALGVPYRFVAARPMFYPVRRPRTHMALLATLDGVPWLCDLGFGSYGIRAPMRLDLLEVAVKQDSDMFMLSLEHDGEYVLKALVEGEWANQYGFDLSHQDWIDFAPANHLNATHPDAIFVQKLLVILHHPEGRDILLGDVLKTVNRGEVTRTKVASADVERVLAERFRLVAKGYRGLDPGFQR